MLRVWSPIRFRLSFLTRFRIRIQKPWNWQNFTLILIPNFSKMFLFPCKHVLRTYLPLYIIVYFSLLDWNFWRKKADERNFYFVFNGFEVNCWIRIRMKTNADLKRWNIPWIPSPKRDKYVNFCVLLESHCCHLFYCLGLKLKSFIWGEKNAF